MFKYFSHHRFCFWNVVEKVVQQCQTALIMRNKRVCSPLLGLRDENASDALSWINIYQPDDLWPDTEVSKEVSLQSNKFLSERSSFVQNSQNRKLYVRLSPKSPRDEMDSFIIKICKSSILGHLAEICFGWPEGQIQSTEFSETTNFM